MKKEILEYLVCPFCQTKFQLETFLIKEQEIIHGLLECRCREYPIINGVPRILPDSFRKELVNNHKKFFKRYHLKDYSVKKTGSDRVISEREKIVTTKRFSYEWKKFPLLYQEYEKQFLGWIDLPKEFFKDKFVLDAGCGTGRHVHYAANYGVKLVIGIDLGESVEVAYKNNQDKNNVHIVQADIYYPPFKDETFDYAYSIGVLHHLPNPEKGFRKIIPLLIKNGHISIWVYGKEGNGLLKIMDPIRKHFISKLPIKIVDALSLTIITPLYPIFKCYRIINESRNFNAVSKILPQNDFFYYLSKLNFRICHCILFDQLLAPTAFYHNKNEINSWFVKAALKNVKVTPRNNNSWRGFGEK